MGATWIPTTAGCTMHDAGTITRRLTAADARDAAATEELYIGRETDGVLAPAPAHRRIKIGSEGLHDP